jgi:hypothetical protein
MDAVHKPAHYSGDGTARPLKIALDHDETFTEDRELWTALVYHAVRRGHEVKFVTWRKPTDDNADIEGAAESLGVGVVYCSGKAKRKCYAADVWIDDSPYSIECHAKWSALAGGDA